MKKGNLVAIYRLKILFTASLVRFFKLDRDMSTFVKLLIKYNLEYIKLSQFKQELV